MTRSDSCRASAALIAIALTSGAAAAPRFLASADRGQAAEPASQNQHTPVFDQTEALAALRRQIAGKESLPAEQVFDNIKDFKGVPAAGLLRGMDFYARSLGVTCLHCHQDGQWARDDMKGKRVARQMSAMVDAIEGALKAVPELRANRTGVSCATCHRGQLIPTMIAPPGSPRSPTPRNE
jgi:hypothetical protein